MQRFVCSQRLDLRTVRMSASTYLYIPQRKDESVLKARIKEITDTRVHYGYRRGHVMLRREGHMDLRLAGVSPVPRGRLVAATEAPQAQQGRTAQAAQTARARYQ